MQVLQLLAIASAVVAGVYVVHYFRYRTAVAQVIAEARKAPAPEREELHGEVTALTKRVEVLEKIVTTRGYALRDELADL